MRNMLLLASSRTGGKGTHLLHEVLDEIVNTRLKWKGRLIHELDVVVHVAILRWHHTAQRPPANETGLRGGHVE